jgi:hypothetical protein
MGISIVDRDMRTYRDLVGLRRKVGLGMMRGGISCSDDREAIIGRNFEAVRKTNDEYMSTWDFLDLVM